MSLWAKRICKEESAVMINYTVGMNVFQLLEEITLIRNKLGRNDGPLRAIYLKNSDGIKFEMDVADLIPVPETTGVTYYFSIEEMQTGDLVPSFDQLNLNEECGIKSFIKNCRLNSSTNKELPAAHATELRGSGDCAAPESGIEKIHINFTTLGGTTGRAVVHKIVDRSDMAMCLAPKQQQNQGRNCFVELLSPLNLARGKLIVDSLREGLSIILLGASGVGKSTQYNFVLEKLVEQLGATGWPSKIFVRIVRDEYYELTANSSGGVDQLVHKCEDMKDFESQYNRRFRKSLGSKPPIILEMMEEGETDPVFCGPLLTSASIRDKKKFPTSDKSGHLFSLVEPLSLEETLVMAYGLALHSAYAETDEFLKSFLVKCDSGRSVNKVLLEKEVTARFNDIGGFPRYVICSTAVFQVARQELYRASVISTLLPNLEELKINVIPEGIKRVVAPFYKPGVTIPLMQPFGITASEYVEQIRQGSETDEDQQEELNRVSRSDNIRFGFTSVLAATEVGKSIKLPSDLQKLKDVGLFYQLQEAQVKFGALLDPQTYLFLLPNSLKSTNWRYFKDVGFKSHLSESDMLSGADVPVSELCQKEALFLGQFMVVNDRNINNIVPCTLHSSHSISMIVCEFFSRKENSLHIDAHQVTSQDLDAHEFNFKTLEKFMRELGMFDGEGKTYTLRLFMYTTNKLSKGLKFVDNTNKDRLNAYNVTEFCAAFPDLFMHPSVGAQTARPRIETYIVAMNAFPNFVKTNILNGSTTTSERNSTVVVTLQRALKTVPAPELKSACTAMKLAVKNKEENVTAIVNAVQSGLATVEDKKYLENFLAPFLAAKDMRLEESLV